MTSAHAVQQADQPRATHGAGDTARFLTAAGVSFFGDWLTTFALLVLLFRITGSVTAPAIFMLLRVAPRVFGPAPGGSLADRFGPSRVAGTCAVAQGAITASIVVFAHLKFLPAIYAAVAVAQFINALSQPSYGALIPLVARPGKLKGVNAGYSTIFASGILVAPAVGALLLPFTTPETLILADAISFMVAAALLLSLKAGRTGASRPGEVGRGITAGIPPVFHDGMLRSLAAGYFTSGAVVTALQAVLVVAASQRFSGDINLGWLYAGVGAGAVVGSLSVLGRGATRVTRAEIVTASVVELVPLAAFVFVPNLIAGVGLLFLSSAGGSLYQTRGAVGLQQRTPHAVMGRVNAVMRFGQYAGMLIGALLVALLADRLGWERVVLIVAAASLALMAAVTFNAHPRGTRAQVVDLPPL